MAELDKGLTTLGNKKNTLTQLSQKNLAPAQSLTQVNEEIQALSKQRGALCDALSQAQRTKQEEESLLRKQLGVPMQSGQIPREGVLVAPIDGHVVWLFPDLRQGAELKGGTPVIFIGVMDPMLLRAQVYESEAQKLKVGQQADITLDSLPGKKFTARVSRLPWAPPVVSLEHPTYYDVEFQVANPDLVLREGMKATVTMRPAGGNPPPEASQSQETSPPKAPGKK